QGMIRPERLQIYIALMFAASGPACNLNDQLCSTFGGTEVHTQQTGINIQNRHQRDIGKMVSLGQHLGADQNCWFTFLNLVIDFLPAADPTGGIAIDPNHLKIRKEFIQIFLDFAGAHTQCNQFLMLTLRTVFRHTVNSAAMMTMQMLIRLTMYSEVSIAVWTLRLPATAATKQDGSTATAV